MSLGKISNSFNLTMERGVKLVPGEIVNVRVLNRIYGKKWAIGIGGRVYSALSDLDLTPNEFLKARVVLEKGQLILKLVNSESSFDATENLLVRLSLPRDEITKEIVKNLLRANLPIDEYIVGEIRKILAKLKNIPRIKAIRLLSLLIDKGIDISKSEMFPLLAILDYSHSDQGRGKNKKEKNKKWRKEILSLSEEEESDDEIKTVLKRQLLRKAEGEDSPLLVFNHLYAKHENWIIFPFSIHWENKSLSGTIRVKYSLFDKNFEKAALQVNIKSGKLFFEIRKDNVGYAITVFCDSPRVEIMIKKNIMYLKSILQNLHVKIDDNIYKIDDFDGFSKVNDIINYHTINTVG